MGRSRVETLPDFSGDLFELWELLGKTAPGHTNGDGEQLLECEGDEVRNKVQMLALFVGRMGELGFDEKARWWVWCEGARRIEDRFESGREEVERFLGMEAARWRVEDIGS